MAVSDIEAVVGFLRKNGFSDSESALMEDVLEKSQLGSCEFQKFLFPLVPPPPQQLKIPLNSSRPPECSGVTKVDDDLGSRFDDSDSDEFVSLDSSTSQFYNSELYSSEFTKCGILIATKLSSQTSSDSLSQFGTARDYHEFDMESDRYWYKDSDEECAVTPHFGILDYDEGPSEDKFVTMVETGELSLHRMDSDSGRLQCTSSADYYYDNNQHMNKTENMSDDVFKDYNDLGKTAELERCINVDREGCNVSCYSAPFSTCCDGSGSQDHGVPEDHGFINLKETEREVSTAISLCNSTKENFNKNGECVYNYNQMAGKPFDPDHVAHDEVAADDEVLMYDAKEDDYEVFNLKVIHRKNRTGFEENKDFPIVINSIIASRYYVAEYIGSAAFSKVIQAYDLYSGTDVCLKIIKNDKDFFDQSLDEIKLLKLVNKYDPGDERHILRLYDYFYHQEHLFIVCELLRANLYEFLKYNQDSGEGVYFTLARLQVITRQCLEALEYLHGLGIIHCDLKPENILIRSYRKCEIKVIDLGSSCFQSDNLSLYVQSRSYRAPEVILGFPYDQRIDLWSLGCILAELYSGEVLFPNEAIAILLARMIAILGPIDVDMLENGQETYKYFTKEFDLYLINEETNELEYVIPAEDASSLEDHLQISDLLFLDFLSKLLEINPQRRLTAREALDHPWLAQFYEPSASEVS